ncbi:MAG: thiosulfate oxidation carrier complex protein SoxZ [Alphaproteobacteria bacterium]|nr:thiosulfate oxidation carrier complex protein SoxZ [Alphaproteobacteria bacterium]
MTRPLVHVPATARKGAVITIKTLIAHPMETGYRPDENGRLIPRDIIGELVCRYNGKEVFRAELAPAIAANPYVAFTTVATETGTLEFRWTDLTGKHWTHTAPITVVA